MHLSEEAIASHPGRKLAHEKKKVTESPIQTDTISTPTALSLSIVFAGFFLPLTYRIKYGNRTGGSMVWIRVRVSLYFLQKINLIFGVGSLAP